MSEGKRGSMLLGFFLISCGVVCLLSGLCFHAVYGGKFSLLPESPFSVAFIIVLGLVLPGAALGGAIVQFRRAARERREERPD